MYPSFSFFDNFIHDIAKVRNDPSFKYEQVRDKQNEKPRSFVSSRKTDMSETSKTSEQKYEKQQCPINNTSHNLYQCRAFRSKPIAERRDFLKKPAETQSKHEGENSKPVTIGTSCAQICGKKGGRSRS